MSGQFLFKINCTQQSTNSLTFGFVWQTSDLHLQWRESSMLAKIQDRQHDNNK